MLAGTTGYRLNTGGHDIANSDGCKNSCNTIPFANVVQILNNACFDNSGDKLMPRTDSVTRLLLLIALATLSSACSQPRILSDGHLAYNEAVRVASDQEVLLNIVRLRYLDSLEFLSISSINSSVDLSVGFQVQLAKPFSDSKATASAGYSSSPTFTFVPQRGGQFAKQLAQPVDIPALIFLASSNRDTHLVFRLLVAQMNGLENEQGEVDQAFVDATNLLTRLQLKGDAVIGFRKQKVVVAPPLPESQVNASQMLAALQHGLEVQRRPEDQKIVFLREVDTATLYVSRDAEDRATLLNYLKLDPQGTVFNIKLESKLDGEVDHDHLTLRTRSLLHGMAFLSQGVRVPPQHLADGTAASGWPHPSVTPVPMDDIFQVWYSAKRPDNASVAVRHRGYWFYMRDDDIQSKNMFFLIVEAFRLALEHSSDQSPVLTIPVG